MYLSNIKIKNHPILGDVEISLISKATNKPYSIVAFVGENGCGKTTLLNEIFNYTSSKYIVEKEKDSTFNALYLRQGSVFSNAMREIHQLIDGNDVYIPNSNKYFTKHNESSLALINDKQEGAKLVKLFGDEQINKLFEEGRVDDIYCSQDISKLISGSNKGYSINNYSSGQQELLLKLRDIRTMSPGTDCVLMDEPETSLHPRWQLDIVKIVQLMAKDIYGDVPQIFLATHSEKVLKSLINNNDTLIVRLYRENSVVCKENISEMDLLLPKPTFAELDYVIFKIDTYEYCSELYDFIEQITKLKESKVDVIIRNNKSYDDKVHHKEWFNEKYGKITSYNIGTYCRNYFHHPKDKEEPTPKHLHDAIELLRNVVLDLKQNIK